MEKKSFFQKLKMFVKRNMYTLVVCSCALFVISTLVAVSVWSARQDNPVIPVLKESPIPNPDGEGEEIVDVGTETNIVFAMPVEGATVGMRFAKDKLIYSKTLKQYQTHLGVDFIAPSGTAVKSVYDGTVESVETTLMEGTIIVIKHSNSLKSIYKSLSSDTDVVAGDKVKKGQTIGKVSSSATVESAEGPHLHFEVKENNEYIDPFTYMPNENN